MTSYNAVKIVGDVVAKNFDHIVIKTQQPNLRQPDQPYEELIPVTGSAKWLKKAKIGKRVLIMGSFCQIEQDGKRRTVIQADEAACNLAVSTDTPYFNLGKLVGRIAQKRIYPPDAGRQGWGYALLAVGEQLFRATFFESMALKFDRIIKRNAVMQMMGRIRNRKYDGGSMLEIVADEDMSRVIEMPNLVDPFLAYTPPGQEPSGPSDENPSTQTYEDEPAF